MKSIAKRLVNLVIGPVEVWTVWEKLIDDSAMPADGAVVPVTAAMLQRARDPEIRSLAGYSAPQAVGFGVVEGNVVVCACWYWYGEHYAINRAFWPLAENDAKLVQITTADHRRGCGLATRLIAGSELEMAKRGFRRLYARIWHGHTASERAFRAAGWHRIARVVVFTVPLIRRPVRLQWQTC